VSLLAVETILSLLMDAKVTCARVKTVRAWSWLLRSMLCHSYCCV